MKTALRQTRKQYLSNNLVLLIFADNSESKDGVDFETESKVLLFSLKIFPLCMSR